ncbi:MAG: tetratricopeptide repeat protein, partial [Woeseiaceae bacterium]
MNLPRCLLLAFFVVTLCGPAANADVKKKDTIKSLERKTVKIRPGNVILDSSDLARDNYRAFLDLVTDDPELRAEAMRRLGDLELESTEADELAQNIELLETTGYDNAVSLYQQLLEAYPDYRRNDTVLYQLARAYEIGGRTDEALDVLNELVAKFPDTALIDAVQFRRGEMLFLRKNYNDAEVAYQDVRKYGEGSRFYEQALYKLGWSQFKLAWHEDSLDPFFELLDRKIKGIDIGEGEERLANLKRAERELV